MPQALSTSAPATWHSHPLLPVTVFLLGLALAAGLALNAQDSIQQGAEAEFQRDTLRIANEVNRLFQKPLYGLNGFKSIYAARPALKRAEFRAAVESRNLPKEFPGVRGFGFIAHLSRTHLDAFVAAEQADGAPGFAIRLLLEKEREDLFVIKLIEPASKNGGVRGLDIGSEPRRRSAAQQAVDTGQPVMTQAVTLVQDAQQSAGVLMFLPVYAQGTDPNNATERRAALVGLVYAPIVIHELLASVSAATASPLDFELQQAGPEGSLLFTTRAPTNRAHSRADGPRFASSQTLLLAGRELTLRTTSAPAFESTIDFARPWWVFVAGAFLSGLLAFVLRQLSAGQRHAEWLAIEMTAQLRHDEERSQDFYQCAADWSWETNAQHLFSYLSDNFAQVYGRHPNRVLGKKCQELWAYAATDLPAHASDYLAQQEAQLPFVNFEYPVHANGGGVSWMSVTGRPYFDLQGRFLGHRGIGSDITARKHAEEALLKAGALQKAIFDSANFSSIATDAKGVIQIFNVGAERMLGYTAAEVMNTITPADISDPQEVIERARFLSAELDTPITPGFEALVFKASRGIEDIYELSYIRKDGSRLPAVVSVTALRDAQDAIIGYLLIGTDNTARKHAEAKLAAEISARTATERIKNDWLRLQSAALDACGNALVIVGVDGLIQWANPAFCELSGYEAAEVVGRSPGALLRSGSQGPDFYQALWQTILAGKSWKGELINRRKDETRYHEEMTITPVHNAQGVVTHFIMVKVDITEHKRIEETAHAANRAKSEFLANMSHEIRTPMNGVIGMVDLLQQTQLDAAQGRMLATVQQSSMVLLNILNDILDFSKIEAGKLSVEHIPLHVRELTEGVAQLMVAACNAKSIVLTLFVSPLLPTLVMGDPTRLRQVLLNLVGNAVKFTSTYHNKNAKVMLLVEPCTLAQGQAGIKLRVLDNGIGIGPEVLGRLFQPFVQAQESTARKFGGTGLGLSISQRLVELMGGCISVDSALGEGSEFCVELALEQAPPDDTAAPLRSLSGLRVLVVIEDEWVRKIVSSYAHAAEARITVLPNLAALQQQQALESTLEPTVVVLDWESFIAPGPLDIPAEVGVVQLVPRNKKGRTDAGAVCTGPLLYSDLISAIAHASGRLSLLKPQDALSPLALPSARVAPSVEQALALGQLVLLAEDNETNRDVMTEQLRLLGYACEAAFDGVQALEMWRTGRYALLLTDVHMPHMDGFELTQAIRQAEPAGARFRIVAITANAMQGEAQRCRERGMDDYLSKPLRMQELAPMLHKWLPLAGQALPALLPESDTRPVQLQVWDANRLGEMVGDNLALHRRLLEKFLANAQTQVQTLVRSTDAGEFAAVADLAHALKSASRMVGALQLGELCEHIETAGSDSDSASCQTLCEDLAQTLAQARLRITEHLEGLSA